MRLDESGAESYSAESDRVMRPRFASFRGCGDGTVGVLGVNSGASPRSTSSAASCGGAEIHWYEAHGIGRVRHKI